MTSATVTSKGQVTIPVGVRNKLGLRPGSRLAFVPTDQRAARDGVMQLLGPR